MRHCIASCLDLMEISDDKRQPCYYNLTSGKCAYFLYTETTMSSAVTLSMDLFFDQLPFPIIFNCVECNLV